MQLTEKSSKLRQREEVKFCKLVEFGWKLYLQACWKMLIMKNALGNIFHNIPNSVDIAIFIMSSEKKNIMLKAQATK